MVGGFRERSLSLTTDPPGAEVLLFRYEERNRRLVEVFERSLGRTPLRAVPLPMGSYLCVLRHPDPSEASGRPVRYPVFVERGRHWDGVPPEGGDPAPVWLPRARDLGPEDGYVPAGWSWTGGDPRALSTLPRRRLWVDGQVFRRFQVRNREYIAFLDDLVRQGREEEALRHAPRERAGTVGELGALVYGYDGQRFHLRPDADGDVWHPEWPVMQVDWWSARAFATWEAGRTGQGWDLPGELAWEKAARGVDGRWFPWGDGVEPTWACASGSRPGPRVPAEVGSFPVDCSPYEVRGLAGNTMEWCADVYRPDGPPVVSGRVPPTSSREGDDAAGRVRRGGCWASSADQVRAADRNRFEPSHRTGILGFRLARPVG